MNTSGFIFRVIRPAALYAALLFLAPSRSQAQDTWLMKGHDVRRTGQSQGLGPAAIDQGRSWSVELPAAMVINVGASVDETGVYFGSWGLLRKEGSDFRAWDKSDGKLFGLAIEDGSPLWPGASWVPGATDLDLVPRCYEYPGRVGDLFWCPFTPYKGSFYNGTVEGQAAIDPETDIMYVGRGDGKLFAIDRRTGAITWRYITFNPLLTDDPDGGGEVVSSPLIGGDGTIYFGTWGEGPYETNAFYAINPEGELVWRYPSEASLPHRFFASPALSPDGQTVYASTYYEDEREIPSSLYAFALGSGLSDEDRVLWSREFEHDSLPVLTTTLAVGTDGTVYVGAMRQNPGVPSAILTAIREDGTFAWSTPYMHVSGKGHYVSGITLDERSGSTSRLYVSTSNLTNGAVEGSLFAVDPSSGAVLAEYDPSNDVPSAVGSINSAALDAAGRIYFGVRGRYDPPVNGHIFAVMFDESQARFEKVWSQELEGYVEWSHPGIGPDGGIYIATSVNENHGSTRLTVHEAETVPEDSSPRFYALKGPTDVALEPGPERTKDWRIVSTFPNPVRDRVSVAMESPGKEVVQAWLVDVLGRVVSLEPRHLEGGRETFSWALPPLTPGVYSLRLESPSGHVRTTSFVHF